MTTCCRDEMDRSVVTSALTLTFVIVVVIGHGQIYQFNKLQDGSNTFNYS